MAPPEANEVCGRCMRSPMTCLSVLAIVIGLLSTFSTVAIGYYLVYREEYSNGICNIQEHPGIRRACVLDLTGGVMSILISVLIIMIEFFSAYLNRNDWKGTFFPIKIFLILFTTIVLVAGAIQGIASYVDYCNDHDDDYHHSELYAYSDGYKRCDFTNRGKFAPDVDFVAVVAFSGVGALLWIVILIIESVRACILCSINSVVTLSVQANGYQRVPTEMNEIPPAPPNYSEM